MGSKENLEKGVRFTSETARIAQKKGVAKRKENAARRKSFKERLLIAFDQMHKLKDGREVDTEDLIVAAWVKKCVDGDMGAIREAVAQIGEAPAQQHDLTTGGESLNDPFMGLSMRELRRWYKELSKGEKK